MEKSLAIAMSVWHVVQLVAPWLVVSFIPSLITGLSLSPKTKGVVPYLQKALSFLSMVTHADASGTFKAPLWPHAPTIASEVAK